jgi:hypothetical protein
VERASESWAAAQRTLERYHPTHIDLVEALLPAERAHD